MSCRQGRRPATPSPRYQIPDTKRYKQARYLLEVIGVVGGGVEVLGHGINRPLMHGLKRRRGCVSDLFCPNYTSRF